MFFKNLLDDIDSMMVRDPAARTRLDVIFSYPGFHALMIYRLGNRLWRWKRYFLGRLVSHMGRWLTGIEIHPGATIGRRLFIDHGMGVVVGETAILGDDVTLYQGVTLGGTSLAGGKRHPTLENGAVVGAGAQVLGPITIGTGARIGANAVVLKDVPADVTMVGIPARMAQPRPKPPEKALPQEFFAYGTPSADMPDPVARAIDGLCDQVTGLQARVKDLEQRLEEAEKSTAATAEPGEQQRRRDPSLPKN
jgi:serine O-acetyltransferase